MTILFNVPLVVLGLMAKVANYIEISDLLAKLCNKASRETYLNKQVQHLQILTIDIGRVFDSQYCTF